MVVNTYVLLIILDNKEKSVFSFTIRDSPEDVVNISVWGSNDYTRHLYNDFKIGDVGKYKIICNTY